MIPAQQAVKRHFMLSGYSTPQKPPSPQPAIEDYPQREAKVLQAAGGRIIEV
jgi:hypothetical protein